MASREKATTEEVAATPVDTAEVNEPTQHSFPTQQSAEPSYVTALEDLFVGGVRAHSAGDRVPSENVERNGWSGSVK